MNNKLTLLGNDKSILSISLMDILSRISDGQNYKWKLLYFDATTETDLDILDLGKEIKGSKSGYLISWNNLILLSNQIHQSIEVLLIGDKHLQNLKRYTSDDEMRISCDFCIELIDSSYWEISCKDDVILHRVKAIEILGSSTPPVVMPFKPNQ